MPEIDEVHRIMNIVLKGIPEENIKFLDNPTDILNVCRENLRGTSRCYGAVEWNRIDLKTQTYNYTLRGNSGLNYVNVGGSQSSGDVFVLPLQFAIDKAIANFTVTPQSLPYTSITEQEYKDKMNKIYMKAIINWLAPALFLSMIGVIYHLAGVVAQERELGITSLLTSMGLPRAVRFLSYHAAFTIVYLLGWIIIAIAFSGELYMKTNAAIIIFYHIISGLSMVSWSIFLGNLFKSTQLAGIFASGFSVFLAIVTTLQTRINATEGPYQSGAVYALSILFPPCNYSYFISTISRWQRELRATNLIEKAPESNIRVIVIFVFAIVQVFLFFGLAILTDIWLYSFKKPVSMANGLDTSSAIQITNLTKVYKTRQLWPKFRKSKVVAVSDLNAEIGTGQIVCLLGANGSGKTTTLEMIAGIQPASSGSITLRPGSKVGICPQKNVLWDNLTVREHIEIWAEIKGGTKGFNSKKSKTVLVDSLIERCDLVPKANTRAGNLSGGQKRKLQLAIMFVGGSNVCCIDEASSGLDPLSRRKIWDILLESRGKLTLILTTHFLDEADLLADNVFIMSKGVLKAEGPTLRLKDRLGGGYRIFVSSGNVSSSAVHFGGTSEKALARVHEEEEETCHEVNSTEEVLETIKSLQHTGKKYRVEGPSLENVFLKVAQGDHEGFKLGKSGAEWVSDGQTELNAQQIAEALQVRSNGTVGLGRQLMAMFSKRFVIFRRNPLAEIVTFILPIIVALATRSFLVSFNGSGCSVSALFQNQEFTDLNISNYQMVAGPETSLLERMSGLSVLASNILSTLPPQNITSSQILGLLNHDTRKVDNISSFTEVISNNYASLMPGGFYLGDSGIPPTVAYVVDLPDFGTYTGSTMLNMLNNVMLNGTVNIVTNFSPFQNLWSSSTGNSLQFVVYFSLAMSVAPAFIGLYPTFERLSKVRAMHYSNGLRIFPLWFAYTSFSFLFFIVSSAILTAIIGSSNSTLIGIGYLFLCFLLYGLSSILLSFFFSLFVQSQLAAFAITAAVQAVYFLVYLIAYLSILAYGSPATIDSNLLVVHFVMAIFMPVANLIRALFVCLNLFGVICHQNGSGRISYLGDIVAYGGPILYMILQIFVLFFALLWWESGKFRINLKSKNSAALSKFGETYEGTTADVSKETDFVDQYPETYEDGLRLSHVHRVFGGKKSTNHVLNDVTFGVRNGECFVLLGPNGAGKTTTFNMIRGEISATSGDIYVNGVSVSHDRSEARSRLGVCPQFDAMDKMKVVEILRFYGKLRGLHEIDNHVEKIIEAVGIVRFRDRMAYKLSGGNKRKLSLAVALIGNPAVLLLDEPSSGMDAFAKRIMWNTLSLVSHGRSIVLTTHSMEEADALASRAGFLAKRMLAIGTVQDLYNQYGQAHHLHVICNSAPDTSLEDMEKIFSWVCETFPGSMAEDKLHQGQIRICIPFQDSPDILPIFRVLEERKVELDIESYTLTPTTLEEVFLKIIGRHEVEEE
ncbi:ATP-binding cassette multidrug transporter PDR5 [Sugiyamaella lignohabitans]|uniref:ATP-binding cassette multidrug transporter PDR5 n=1 Tax=Sugiyamaella lignohabitans TaxID=796027 RepID=A0A161HMY8_9ASCO|nr:ATP-binding cassette multidrug transporter PDR5 [Sugiyamaella lignohabitans]ANB15377.1 ATP-binding cassette multidrug transporter PDR5 [Sugiyamaella lignohabitans]